MERKIYLSKDKIKNIWIFDGYNDFNTLINELNSYNVPNDSYYIIRFCNMLYAFLYNDWNELILGKNELYYLNLDSHFCKRTRNNEIFDWPYDYDEMLGRCVPNVAVFGVANDLIRMDRMLSIYYMENNKWYQIDKNIDEIKFKSIINEFGKQFYRDFYFSRIEVHMYLKPYFDSNFLEHMDKFYVNGAFEINPFSWKVTIDNTKKTLYCSFFDSITKKPICEMGGKFFPLNKTNFKH